MPDLQPPGQEPGPQEQGVRRCLQALAAFVLLAGLPYLVPGMERLRPWIPGDPLPFEAIIGLAAANSGAGSASRVDLPAMAGGLTPWTGSVTEAGDLPDDRTLLASLPAAGSPEGTAGSSPGPGQAAPSPPGSDHSPNHEPAATPSPAPESPPARPLPEPVRLAELEGMTRELTLPDPAALAPLHRKLADAELGRPGSVVRLLVYGASTLGDDGITSSLRRRLQARFGDAGKGFVALAPAWPTQSHRDLRWSHGRDPWRSYPVTHRSRGDGRYGLGGVLSINQGHSIARFATVKKGPVGISVSHFELWYHAGPRGGSVEISVDRGEGKVLNTRASQHHDRVFDLEMADGPHQVQVRAIRGRSQIYGAVLERAGPGVVVDTAMLIGARANRLLNFDPDHWAAQIARRKSDLLVLFMGDNEIESEPPPRIDHFEHGFGQVLTALRKGRAQAACLVLSPADHGMRHRGRIITKPLVHEVVAAERRAALSQGCAFLDLFQAMGGDGSMGRWFRARPRLGWGDLMHFTGRGSEVLGIMIYKALLADYARWIERQRERASGP